MTTENKQRVKELATEITNLTNGIRAKLDDLAYSKTDQVLIKIGEMLHEKNLLTGGNEDIKYFYLDDGEWYRIIAGFIGDDSGTTDVNGVPLKIGDTVKFTDTDGYSGQRIILHEFLNQEFLNERKAIKVKDYTDFDIKDACTHAFTVTEHSCLDMYLKTQNQGMTMNLGG